MADQTPNLPPPPLPVPAPRSKLRRFYDWYIYPNRVKIAWITIFVLAVILVNVFRNSLKKDQTLNKMEQELKLKEQERQDIIADRAVLENKLNEHDKNIQALTTRDSLLQVSVTQMSGRIEQIKIQTNEKIKVIEHYTSADLQQYYKSLPNDY